MDQEKDVAVLREILSTAQSVSRLFADERLPDLPKQRSGATPTSAMLSHIQRTLQQVTFPSRQLQDLPISPNVLEDLESTFVVCSQQLVKTAEEAFLSLAAKLCYDSMELNKIAAAFRAKVLVFLNHLRDILLSKVKQARETVRSSITTESRGFSYTQSQILHALYKINTQPTPADFQLIARKVGITYKQCRVWFQNRRNRKVQPKLSLVERRTRAQQAAAAASGAERDEGTKKKGVEDKNENVQSGKGKGKRKIIEVDELKVPSHEIDENGDGGYGDLSNYQNPYGFVFRSPLMVDRPDTMGNRNLSISSLNSISSTGLSSTGSSSNISFNPLLPDPTGNFLNSNLGVVGQQQFTLDHGAVAMEGERWIPNDGLFPQRTADHVRMGNAHLSEHDRLFLTPSLRHGAQEYPIPPPMTFIPIPALSGKADGQEMSGGFAPTCWNQSSTVEQHQDQNLSTLFSQREQEISEEDLQAFESFVPANIFNPQTPPNEAKIAEIYAVLVNIPSPSQTSQTGSSSTPAGSTLQQLKMLGDLPPSLSSHPLLPSSFPPQDFVSIDPQAGGPESQWARDIEGFLGGDNVPEMFRRSHGAVVQGCSGEQGWVAEREDAEAYGGVLETRKSGWSVGGEYGWEM